MLLTTDARAWLYGPNRSFLDLDVVSTATDAPRSRTAGPPCRQPFDRRGNDDVVTACRPAAGRGDLSAHDDPPSWE